MKKANEIKTMLANKGWNKRDFSVKTGGGSINVTVKNLAIDLDLVKAATEHLAKYSRCEATGEILQGGNTFVFVEYDHMTMRNFTRENHDAIKAVTFKLFHEDTEPRYLRFHTADKVKEFFSVAEPAMRRALMSIFCDHVTKRSA